MDIPDNLIQEITTYLSFKPYREVAGLLAAIQKAVSVKNSPKLPSNKEGDKKDK